MHSPGQHACALAMRLEHSIAVSSSLMRKCRIASSSSRATCSGPERCGLRDHAVDIGGRTYVRRLDGNVGCARRDDIDGDKP